MSTGEGRLDRRALRDQVYDRVLELLLSGEIAAGERLSIDTMARDLSVSPTPVREALVQLERTGLVTREALKGYRVAPPLDPEQLTELFDARIMLEETAARLSTAATDRLLPDLREAHARHRAASDEVLAAGAEPVPLPVTQRYFDADRAFHDVIFAHSGNRYLVQMYDGLGALTHRMRQAALRGPEDVREAVAEHEAVLKAYENDPATASEALRRHVTGVRNRSLSGH
ncbi:GntR family transcriptional regulator [Microlunatus parietis]|uniref:DNA-binding GntR family transcriptional regulator n=1 Tax=Microlunatus parietis TaxID=682979 RepID=A0A7Y9IAK2_9ACTN|nr:GntR family transcriptional regulator [Microlunatus parietis]NYE73088.1 DNA-binding GntR family transcriptional regulator [Microlunatus parietis]